MCATDTHPHPMFDLCVQETSLSNSSPPLLAVTTCRNASAGRGAQTARILNLDAACAPQCATACRCQRSWISRIRMGPRACSSQTDRNHGTVSLLSRLSLCGLSQTGPPARLFCASCSESPRQQRGQCSQRGCLSLQASLYLYGH